MRALLALLVVLVAVLGGLYLLVGNPLDLLQEQQTASGELPTAATPDGRAVVAASGETGDATPPELPPAPAGAQGVETPAQPIAPLGGGTQFTSAATDESGVPRESPAAAPPVASAAEPEAVEEEARDYLQTLTEPVPEPVAAESADHFVRPDQMITMVPEEAVETTTLGELKADETLDPDSPITVVRTIEQIEASTASRVIAQSGGDLDAPIRVLDETGEGVRESTVREVLEEHRKAPSKPIMVVREVEHLEVTTLAKLEADMRRADTATGGRAVQGESTPLTLDIAPTITISRDSGIEAPAAPLPGPSTAGASGDKAGPSATTLPPAASSSAAATAPAAGGAATVTALAASEATAAVTPAAPAAEGSGLRRLPLMERPIRIVRTPAAVTEATVREILLSRDEAVEPESIFYVRTVQRGDEQGIWGIVHHGIIDNFARGMAIRRGEEVNTYRVEIPYDADELERDRTSSFLGRLIFDKARESHVYNYRLNRMGQNPDRIYPGQELVIIQFQPEELVSIYRHFVERQG